MPSLGRVLMMASIPVLKILVMCAIGAFLATPKLNAFPSDARKHMNKLVFLIFLPSLIFTRLAEAVTADKLIDWWYMPLNVLLSFAVGASIGLIVVKFTKPPQHLENLTIACCSAGNTGNVPLVLIPGICEEEDNPFGTNLSCTTNGVAYVSFGMWMATLLVWTFIYNIMLPSTSNIGFVNSKEKQPTYYPNIDSNIEGSLLKTSPKKDKRVLEMSSPSISMPSILSIKSMSTNISTTLGLQQIFTPPTTAAILALLIGGCAPLKNVIIGPHAPLRFLTNCFDILGDATIPCMNLILGGNLVSGVNGCALKSQTTLGVLSTRFLFLPLIGCGLVLTVINLKLIPNDPLFHFVLLLQFCMPTAINVGTIAQVHGNGEIETSMILFWSYTSSVIFLTLWIMFFLSQI